MTLRPAFIATTLLAVVTAGAVTTLTHTSAQRAPKADQQICLVLAKDNQHQQTQDFCVDWGNALK